MDWKAHLLFGILLGALAAIFIFHFGPADVAGFCAISGASALLPDLDLRKSKASQITYILAGAALVAAAIYLSGWNAESAMGYLALLLIAFFAFDFFIRPRHRGVMHGFLFLSIATVLAYAALGGFVASAFLAGYSSHLLADGALKLA